MEIIVCLLTTGFFAALEIRDIKVRSARKSRHKDNPKDFVVVPYRPHADFRNENP